MKINSFSNNKIYNVGKKEVSDKKDANVVQSQKSSGLSNVSFQGLFIKKPFDATVLFNPIYMRQNEEYLVDRATTFQLGYKVFSLNDKDIADCIENLQPNQRLFITNGNSEHSQLPEDNLSIRKDAQGQLFASTSAYPKPVQILSNVVTLNTCESSSRLDSNKYYEIPLNSILKLNEVEVDLSDYKEQLLALENGEKLSIGRSDDADIMIDDEYISRLHCSIEKRADKYLLKDLNSTNGTRFLRLSIPEKIEEETDIYTLPKGVPTKVEKDSQIYLGNDFAIDLRNKKILNLLYIKGEITVGRSDDCDLVVSDFYDMVSRHHLNISMNGDGEIYVTDLGSTNATQVIPKNKIQPFYQGVENIELRQGNIGDCYLLSNLYALSRNPKGQKLIEKMVRVDNDGNYVVSFYNKESIIVPLEQLDGQKLEGKEKISVAGELGVRAIERAYGKMLRPIEHLDKTLFMNIDNGGKINETLFNLVGKYPQYFYIPKTNVHQKFAELAQKPMKNYVMLCSTHQKGRYGDYMDKDRKFISLHAYAIKNFDVDKKLVEIVNPHNTKHSEFVHFDDFQQMFDFMHVLEM